MSADAFGLTWHPQWVSREESAYAIASKLSAANPMRPSTLRKLVLDACALSGSVRRPALPATFLSNHWMIRGASRCSLASDLYASTLNHRVGNWAFKMAGDRHLRYCPVCLDSGFHAAVCQMEALITCPVHGQPLTTLCRHCGAKTPAFSWDEGFESPVSCRACRMPLSAAWSPDNAMRWTPMPGSHVYGELERQLRSISKVERRDTGSWNSRYAGDDEERRRAESALLVHASGLKLSREILAAWESPNEFMVVNLLPRRKQISEDMRFNYATFCRKILPPEYGSEARLALKRLAAAAVPEPSMEDYGLEGVLPYILLRSRFELDYRQLSHRFLSNSLHPLLGNFTTHTWQQFLDMCYRAEIRYCQLLRDRTQGLTPGEPEWRTAIRHFGAALNPRESLLPYGLGIFKVSKGIPASAVIALA